MPRNLYVDCYPNLFNTPRGFSAPVFLEFPVAVVEWTHLARFEPPRDAVEVERVVAHPPGRRALRPQLVGDLSLRRLVEGAPPGSVADGGLPAPVGRARPDSPGTRCTAP